MSDAEMLSAQRLRALAHPTRTAIVRHLAMHHPARVADIAAAVDVAPNVASFHIRQLEKHGFVRRAQPPQALGTERWWEPVETEFAVSLTGVPAGEEGREVRAALRASVQGLAVATVDRLMTRGEELLAAGTVPPEDTFRGSNILWWLTPDEAAELGKEISALIARWGERGNDPHDGASLWSLAVTYFEDEPRAVPPQEETP